MASVDDHLSVQAKFARSNIRSNKINIQDEVTYSVCVHGKLVCDFYLVY